MMLWLSSWMRRCVKRLRIVKSLRRIVEIVILKWCVFSKFLRVREFWFLIRRRFLSVYKIGRLSWRISLLVLLRIKNVLRMNLMSWWRWRIKLRWMLNVFEFSWNRWFFWLLNWRRRRVLCLLKLLNLRF